MILLAGLRPDTDVKIKVTGLRPGEKLYEELFHDSEPPQPTATEGVLLAAPRVLDYGLIKSVLEQLAESAQARNSQRTLELISQLVPEFQPPEISVSSILAEQQAEIANRAVDAG